MRRLSIAGLLAVSALPLLLNLSGGSPSSPVYGFTRLSAPHVETVVGWMFRNAAAKAVDGLVGTRAAADDARAYFAMAGRAGRLKQVAYTPTPADPDQIAALSADLSPLASEAERLRSSVESLVQRQVSDALLEAGLGHQVGGGSVVFPPLVFRFESLPKVLVVSPRTRIERSATVLLRPQLTLEDSESLEESVARRGFSALVTQIGGLGVYPSMVPETSDIRFVLRTVAHEWAHQFFTLKPVGWRYAFGAERDVRMITINETAAEILGREIGDSVYRERYDVSRIERSPPIPGESLNRQALRRLRLDVDALLAVGNVAEAERRMEATRQDLARQGYYIRKLNQAYFAFHGSYADEPSLAGADGEDISSRMHALRARSESLGDFIWKISSVGSYEEFRRLVP